MIINLISGPRNVSTALMYAFAQRSDTSVVDEPFYAVFLAKTGLRHPGYKAILHALPQDEKTARAELTLQRDKPVLFVKNMAHHMEALEQPFIPGARNIFLIRDPHQILASYAEVISNPTMRDIGIAYQYSLFRQLREEGTEPVVIDADCLLTDPASVLATLCSLCRLNFEQRMVHWPQGPKPYDGVWAPYWYASVHRTTGFARRPARSPTLPNHLHGLYHEAKAFYDKLLPFSIKA